MKRRVWMVGATMVMIGALVGTALAEEPPAPPAGGAVDRTPAAGDLEAPQPLEDMDGLDLLLAAHGRGGRGPGGGMGPGRNGGRRMDGEGGAALHERLQLSDDQRSKLADIHDRRQRAAIPVQADLKVASLDLRKLMRADRPDARAIDAQIDRIASLRATLQKAHVAGMMEARTVLTPAQRKLMREHHEGMRGRHRPGGPGMRGMHGGGMHGGPGAHEGAGVHGGHDGGTSLR